MAGENKGAVCKVIQLKDAGDLKEEKSERLEMKERGST